MKHQYRFLYIMLCLMLLGLSGLRAQEVQVKLSVTPMPSSHLSDWQSDPTTIIVTITNLTTQPITGTLSGTLERDGITVASIKENARPSVTLAPGSTQLRGAQVLPVGGVQFSGASSADAQRTATLPEGQYRICVRFDAMINGNSPTAAPRTISSGDCQGAMIQSITSPILITPADQGVVENPLPVFTWTPASPSASTVPARYQLKIVEILGRQRPYDALQSNPPIFLTETNATSQAVPASRLNSSGTTIATPNNRVNGTGNTTNKTVVMPVFAWAVTSFDATGHGNTSTPSQFSLELPVGREITDTDCNKYSIEHARISNDVDGKCHECDSLANLLNALQQQLDLANQDLSSAETSLSDAKKNEESASKNAAASAKKFDAAVKSFSSMAKGAGLTVVPYGPPSGFSGITRAGYGTVGGNSGASGIAVQGSNGALVAAGNSYGRTANGSSNFWAAFRNINALNAANQASQGALTAAQAATQQAQQRVDDLKAMIKSLEAQIAAAKGALADCLKQKQKLIDQREDITRLHDECLHRIDEQRKAQQKIHEAEDALTGAGSAIGSADGAISNGQSEVDNRPGAGRAGRQLGHAGDENTKARGDSTKADDLIKRAKQAQESGNTDEASKLAEQAKKAAEQATAEAQTAERDAHAATDDAMDHPTKDEIAEAQRRARAEAEARAKQIKERAERSRFICTKWLLAYMKEHHQESWSEWFQSWADWFDGANSEVADGLSAPTDKFKEMMDELSKYATELKELSQLFEGMNTDDPMKRAEAFGAVMDIAARISEKVPGFKEFIGFYAEAYHAAIEGIQKIANELDRPYIGLVDNYLRSKGCDDATIAKWENKSLDQILDLAWSDFLARNNTGMQNSDQERRLKEYFRQQYMAKILACCLQKMKVTFGG